MHPDTRVVPFPVIDPPANPVTANRWKQIAEECEYQLNFVRGQLDDAHKLAAHLIRSRQTIMVKIYAIGCLTGAAFGYALRGLV